VTINYRRPQPDEAEALAALHVQCWREAYAAILPAELMATFTAEKRLPLWHKVIPGTTRFVLGAFDQSQPVGFVISGPCSEKYIEDQDGNLDTIYIASSHYRMGIGRELLGCAAKDWLQRGGRTMTVGVLAENLRARRFYESMGARLVKLTTYNWDGHELPDAIYVFEDLKSLIP
jgi:ribosomal protein S18 acetylase RimI-like enzyme